MWSREKITALSERLGLNETQIYKWWWDQTRKRAKRLQKESSKKVGKQVLNLE
jgi:transposase-like protein